MIDRTIVPSSLSAYGAATAAAVVIGGYLVVAEPYVGLVLHRRFEVAARRHEDARRWLYRRILLLEWVLAGLCIAVVALAPGVGAASVGVRTPDGGVGLGLTVGATLGAGVLLALTARQVARAEPGHHYPLGGEGVLAMLPRTPVERRLFTMVSITAGVCEELVFRGFLIALLAALVPAAPVWVCALAAAVVFGLAHLYQGAVGVVTTFVMGLVLGALYVISGSLLAPILVHAMVDLRAIWLGRLVAPVPQGA
jgi:membrane protease YdiL (CAAX protease family)